jgi:Na+/melibiose symporter-like transporter
MNKEDLYGIGMILAVISTAIIFMTDGNPLISISTILYIIFIIGMGIINKAFNETILGEKK